MLLKIHTDTLLYCAAQSNKTRIFFQNVTLQDGKKFIDLFPAGSSTVVQNYSM